MTMSYFPHELEPCLARLGITPEDKPSFVREVYAVDDIETLRQIIIKKERERQGIANDLDVAARIGLVISETNEAIQIKLEQLERENRMFQEELRLRANNTRKDHSNNNSNNNTSELLLSEEDERIYLTQELDQARRELTKFRKEMDGLSAQLNDMASEMVDSRSKVSVYAKRLAEVEQKLASTRDVNTSLQSLLDKALTSQKQSSSNTSHLVVTENEQLRARIAELEHQQIECEEKLAAMVIQAQEYASRLEQAQDTIHNMSEPKLLEDDELSSLNNHSGFNTFSVSSQDGTKETEITKGPVFSAEFRQEMQKEIERNLTLKNEIRHRIITADTVNIENKKKSQEGLKYLVSERESGGLASLSTSTSSSTNSSILSTVMKKEMIHTSNPSTSIINTSNNHTINTTPHITEEEPKAPVLRPASFLTGFSGFGGGSEASGMGMGAGFITRGIPPRTFTSSTQSLLSSRGNEPKLDSDSSDDEWVINSTKTQPRPTKTNKSQRLTISAASIRTIEANISKSCRLPPYQPNLPLPSPILKSVPILQQTKIVSKKPIEMPSLQFISDKELHQMCLEMDADLLVSRLIDVYKSCEIFIRIREIETEAMSIEMRLKDHLSNASDPCGFILSVLTSLSVYFSEHPKNKDLTSKFRRLLTTSFCTALARFLNTPVDKRQLFISSAPETDLITFDDNTNDLISFDEVPQIKEEYDDDDDDSEEDDVITIEANDRYSLTRNHQLKLIGMMDTIPSPVIVYYSMDVYKLGNLISSGCEFEDDGVKLCKLLVKHCHYDEAVNCIKKLNLYARFPINSIADQYFTVGHGPLLATLTQGQPDLQKQLLSFINKQLRFNYAGNLDIIPRQYFDDLDNTQQLSRLKERKFQKDLVSCGVKILKESGLEEKDYYFISLSQRYAGLRYILAQRAIQQAEDGDLSIEASSNFNGLIDLLCEDDAVLARLAIKELIDIGDTIAPPYFASLYKQQEFYCRYNALPINQRLLGVVKGEQMSRHRSMFSPKKVSNQSGVAYYKLPLHAKRVLVDSHAGLIHLKDVLSTSNVCGIDTEWIPAFAKSNSVKTALMQIACDIEGYVFLLDLKTIFLPQNSQLFNITEKILQLLFEDDQILKIAYDFNGDFDMLYSSIPSSKNWKVSKLLDLKSLKTLPTSASDQGQIITGGLAGVTFTFLGVTLNKRQQLSNWEKRPLTEEQAIYGGIVFLYNIKIHIHVYH
ncbi:hypothetical protein INT48_008030 [Thamnidium elegans]|uniref:3'-5' exonuclease domain-containing protein n=1 Tax=Thamnidium elegans TaxID=101142 RepID=A0A8H7SPH3_9FUNG|nr:hypothetical protein INT48_008030 [Thamnidium elegans]